jgi:predicted ester cyclase
MVTPSLPIGIPPSGKKVSFVGVDFLTIIDGKITEEWVSLDTMGLMQQIGAIPADAHASSSARS